MSSLEHKEDTVEDLNSFATLRVRVAATFTAEPLEESLGHWLRKLGFSPDITFAPYGQVFQELLNPAGLVARNTEGISLLLVRVEDWFRFASGRLSAEKLEAAVTEFEAALKGFAARGGGRLLLGLCPHTSDSVRRLGLSEELMETVDARLLECVRGLSSVEAADLRDLTDAYMMPRVFDEEPDRLGHIPFTPEFYAAMGAQLARRVLTRLHSPLKVLVLDCDNTLWKGVCGEDGPHRVEITAELAEFQEFLLRQQQGGRLLCLCSKNNEADVWEVFDHNPQMRLRRSHIVASRINWRPKSENILSLSCELNLEQDSFLLIDDDPAECAGVEHVLPGVSSLCLPADSRMSTYLRHHWAFDAADATDEDGRRTELYRQNAAREGLRAQVAGHEEFIRQLRVETEINLLRREYLPRAAQLTQRTNQFNATSVRRHSKAIFATIRKHLGSANTAKSK